MKAFRYRKYCATGFFSKIIIMESICRRKKAKKTRKSFFLINEWEFEKVIEFRPPLFFNFRGVILLQKIPSKIMISEKNPFAQQFVCIKGFIWSRRHPPRKFWTNPNMALWV